ncbi:TonB-dependent receptor [Flavobacterium psychraquaticum]|uniref:SusC/RagA family TonB-linked outer membrane protein n=1 Tax=Flavobacterium psychraquaticum TaxID=3103958 RepID=UPI002ACDF725|nr:TonB-dependent receptor [Flavobacterium sp. LB-N7T]
MRSKFKWIFTLLVAFTMQFSFAQQKTVKGVVSDEAGTIAGATVIVKGTTRGVTTDFDGIYTINAKKGDVLVFSYLGFTTKSIVVGDSDKINVSLESDVTVLKDVVLTGYQVQSKAKTTSAITTVNVEELEERAQASVIQNLQGMVAGLNIATGSGQPGSDSTILLRGVGSLNGNIEPLIIVDGMPVDEDGFRSISQNDIVSTSVLRDAAATSIYGNRGANGVIVIETRRGKFEQELEIKYQGQYGVSNLQEFKIDVMNSKQLLEFQRTYNVGAGAGMTDAQIAAALNTDWRDQFFRTGTTQQHDVSMSSGSKNSKNYTSIGFLDQDGIFITSNFKRFNFRNNFTGKTSNDKFTYTAGLSLNYTKSNNVAGAGGNATYFQPFTAAIRGLPYLDPSTALTITGAPNVNNAPLILLNSLALNKNLDEELKILTNLTADYKITKEISTGINLGVDYSSFTAFNLTNPGSFLGPYQVNISAQYGGIQGESFSRDFRFNSNTYLKYNKTFNEKHTVDAGLYLEYYKAHFNGFNYQKRGLDPRALGTGAAFITPVIEPAVSATATQYIPTIGSFKVQEGLFSYFGAIDYDYDGKYGVSATVRRDASFRFIDDNKWGTFWSVGGRWNLSREAFLENSTVFNDLKLRASYGTSGNQRVNNAQYSALLLPYTTYSVGTGYNGTSSTVLSQIKNPDVKWEEINQLNVGLDFAVLDNKLKGSIDVYRKVTEDLYQGTPVSPVQGTSSIDANIGSLENKGFEVSLDYRVYNDKDWRVAVGGNVSYNKNKILELPESANGLIFAGGSTAIAEGQPVGAFYVSEYAGVNPVNGNPLFKTPSGGLTEILEDANRVFTGEQLYPVWQGGFTSNVSYKGFNLYTQWSFVADLSRNNLDLATLESVSTLDNGGNRAVSIQNAWTNPGDITSMPRIGNGYNEINYINGTDRYLDDASYLRLRNISFSYTFGNETLKRIAFLKGLKFYVQAENMVTFSKWRGWDPEAGFRGTDRGNYPTPKIVTFGTVINF